MMFMLSTSNIPSLLDLDYLSYHKKKRSTKQKIPFHEKPSWSSVLQSVPQEVYRIRSKSAARALILLQTERYSISKLPSGVNED